jgi:hypothetical protein
MSPALSISLVGEFLAFMVCLLNSEHIKETFPAKDYLQFRKNAGKEWKVEKIVEDYPISQAAGQSTLLGCLVRFKTR